jgi:pilus assembly protein CpaE
MSVLSKRFLLLLDDGIADGPIRASLRTARVEIARLDEAIDRTDALIEEAAPDVVLVACSAHSDAVLHVIGELSGKHARPTVVLYQGTPNGFMEAAFGMGAEDIILLPQPPEDLAFAIEKVIARRRGVGVSAEPGPMISILGPKGGTGKTLTTCNLAVALARAGTRPVVVDLDLQFGDVGLALGLQPVHTIHDLAVAGGSLDSDKVDNFLIEHPSGARVLLAPTRPDHAAAVSITFLRELFDILRHNYDYVVVDTPPSFSPEVIAAIDASSHLCVVGMLDALSLKDTKIGLETLQQMGYDPSEIVFVLNRADSNVGITSDDVQQLLGRRAEVLVPSDRAVPRALTVGRTIVEVDPKAGPSLAFNALAARYLEGSGNRRGLAREERSARPERPRQRLALLRKAG